MYAAAKEMIVGCVSRGRTGWVQGRYEAPRQAEEEHSLKERGSPHLDQGGEWDGPSLLCALRVEAARLAAQPGLQGARAPWSQQWRPWALQHGLGLFTCSWLHWVFTATHGFLCLWCRGPSLFQSMRSRSVSGFLGHVVTPYANVGGAASWFSRVAGVLHFRRQRISVQLPHTLASQGVFVHQSTVPASGIYLPPHILPQEGCLFIVAPETDSSKGREPTGLAGGQLTTHEEALASRVLCVLSHCGRVRLFATRWMQPVDKQTGKHLLKHIQSTFTGSQRPHGEASHLELQALRQGGCVRSTSLDSHLNQDGGGGCVERLHTRLESRASRELRPLPAASERAAHSLLGELALWSGSSPGSFFGEDTTLSFAS
uniref:Uncharacterized protein n=1 Tax=Rangifer tarandus platyrhynchus TaxID=3082113 RepID=A0ACB0FIF9_RANTA|nr:unnamed protein product [Rangifer tarandus platyrhynchus]